MKLPKKISIIFTISILILSLNACSLPGLGESAKQDGIVVAGGNTTERQILSEIVVQMCKEYIPEAKISTINNLGSSLLILQTMERKDVNVSGAMYTGTSLTGELGLEPTTDPKKAFELVVKGYREKYDSTWFPSWGFENTYAFMVKRSFAEENNLKTISDLREIAPTLEAGVDTSWMERHGDGYNAFKELYGFDFKKVFPMEIGLVYSAVESGNMDIVLGYSTDGRISSYDLVILKDDLRLFPPYDASPVAKNEILKKYPKLKTILQVLGGKISSETMQEMNRMGDEDLIEPGTIARNFLKENNYFVEEMKKGGQ